MKNKIKPNQLFIAWSSNTLCPRCAENAIFKEFKVNNRAGQASG